MRDAQGRLPEAAAGYERALLLEEKVYADEPNHPELAGTVEDLADVYAAQGRLIEAEEGYERVLRMRRAKQPDHVDLTETVNKLASVRKVQGGELSKYGAPAASMDDASCVSPVVKKSHTVEDAGDARPTTPSTTVATTTHPSNVLVTDTLEDWAHPSGLQHTTGCSSRGRSAASLMSVSTPSTRRRNGSDARRACVRRYNATTGTSISMT